jgi:hypothetical protein
MVAQAVSGPPVALVINRQVFITAPGPQHEMDDSLVIQLNADFRQGPKLLPEVAKLVTSAVLQGYPTYFKDHYR